MKLFYLRHACSLAPHIASKELGLSIQLERVDPRNKEPLLKFNPKGQVPTLVLDDGKVLTETAVMLQYLSDQKPEKELVPKYGTWERWRCMEWLNYTASELHKSFPPFFNLKAQLDDAAKAVHRNALEKKYEFLNNHFADHQFLMGPRFSAADIYLFVVVNWSKGAQIDLAKFPNLYRFWEQMKARPATKAAMDGEERTPI